MKKLLSAALVLFFVPTTVCAQDYSKWERNNINLRIGPEVGFPVGGFNKTHHLGLGGSALLDVPLARRWSVIFYGGIRSFAGDKIPGSDTKFKRSNIVPLRTGVNYKLSSNFYVSGQIGESTVQYLDVSKTSVSHALGIGYFNGFLDLGVRWDYEYAHGGLSSIAFQARYVITFGVKERY